MDRDLSGSRAILIGNSIYRDPGIPDIPGASLGVQAMSDLLTGELCGWPADRVQELVNIASPSELALRILAAIKEVDSSGILLLYYVGHGQRTTDGQLALTVGDTDLEPRALPHTAILYDSVAKILRGCQAATKLVILDCCHAELGTKANYQFLSADLADAYPVDGLYFIGASRIHEKAKASLTLGLTHFTRAFIDVVHTGIPGKPSVLRLDQIFVELRSRMLREDLPEPVESGFRGARQVPFARNAAPPQTHVDLEEQLRRLAERLAELERARDMSGSPGDEPTGISESRGRSPREADLHSDLTEQGQETEKRTGGRVSATDDASSQTAGNPGVSDGHGISAAPDDFGVGSRLASYRLDEIIGRGGMAVVYRAYDTRLGRQVAVKVMAPELAQNDTFRQQFIRESRTAAAVDHPNIIPIYEASEASGVLFIAMRFVTGHDVQTLVETQGPLPIDQVCHIVSQVAAALEAAHSHGLVHRDVKLGNILLDGTASYPGHAYLSDFGLSKHALSASALTSTGQLLNTVEYIAPEQIEGRGVDGRTDEYALACAAFAMFTGAPPFNRDQAVGIMWAQMSSEPPPVTSRRRELPPAVDAVMAKALAKSAGDRYATCPEFAADLRQACGPSPGGSGATVDGQPSRAAHVGISEPRLLVGRYELDGVVGLGGLAEVYRARDIRLDRIVAVKTLREDLAWDQTFQARFRREAQSAASLNHPSIVAVYDTGEDMVGQANVPYVVMEYVDGRTLRELLRDDRRLLPERALEITDGVLRALDYSHRNGIVHRDIKPGNVMLTRSAEVKVMDFGIPRAVSDDTPTGEVIGTADYMSPEQARGERVDARSDLYSTGCLLYELLTGRPPFSGDSPVAIAYQHVRENPIPPSRVDSEIPAWDDSIVLKAMAKDPAERYQSAAEMRTDIQRALSGVPVAAPPGNAIPSYSAMPVRPTKKRNWWHPGT